MLMQSNALVEDVSRYIFIYYNRVRIYTRNPLELPPVKCREWMQAQQAA